MRQAVKRGCVCYQTADFWHFKLKVSLRLMWLSGAYVTGDRDSPTYKHIRWTGFSNSAGQAVRAESSSPACFPPRGRGTSWGRSDWPGCTPCSAAPPPPADRRPINSFTKLLSTLTTTNLFLPHIWLVLKCGSICAALSNPPAPDTHSCSLTHVFRAVTTKLLCRKCFEEVNVSLKTTQVVVLGRKESHCCRDKVGSKLKWQRCM